MLCNGPEEELVTLDINIARAPDIVWDLRKLPIPLPAQDFDEVHAYHVIEHLWQQGDYVSFFAFFSEVHRLLKPNGMAFFTFPTIGDDWVYGDPSHTCVIHPHQFSFLSQKFYSQCDDGSTKASDFRYMYAADLEIVALQNLGYQTAVALRKV